MRSSGPSHRYVGLVVRSAAEYWRHLRDDCRRVVNDQSYATAPPFQPAVPDRHRDDPDAVKANASPEWSFWLGWY